MSKPYNVSINDGIAELIFNKPPVNAFDSQGWFDIAAEIRALGEDDAVRVIIIAAEGKGFCAGVDIKELAADSRAILKVNRGNYDTFKAIHLNPKPVIVGLHGFVLGGGIGLMHYSGMAAVEFDAFIRYDPLLFALSLLVAIGLAMSALWVAFRVSRRDALRTLTGEILAALLIGLAVAGMHYTAMSSTVCFARTGATGLAPDFSSSMLAGATAVVASLILIPGIAAVVFDRRLASEVFHRVEASQRAHQTGQRLQMIMDNVADAVITLDDEGRIETCNTATDKMFGFSPPEFIGLNISYLLSNLKTNHGRTELLRYFTDPSERSEDGNSIQVIGRHKNGKHIYLEAKLTEVRQGNRSVIVAALRDITERNVVAAALARAKDAAERANQAKSEFISHMSHELRTPLNAVIGISEMLMEVPALRDDPQKLKNYLSDINNSGKHLLSLVNEILDVSIIEAGGRSLEFETFDAAAEIENLITILKSADDGASTLSLDDIENPVLITADKQSFRQTILNLASNSISHGGQGVEVSIRIDTDVTSDFAKITVADNGPGIPEDMLSSIGQPFLKARAAYQYSDQEKSSNSAGLGLYLVNRLMVLNGGKFSLESAPGKGTVVTTLWPKTAAAA